VLHHSLRLYPGPYHWRLFLGCQAFLSGLNYHWTLTLVLKLLKRRQGKPGGSRWATRKGLGTPCM